MTARRHSKFLLAILDSILYDTMIEIRYYENAEGSRPILDWIEGLKDKKTRAVIKARIARLATGNFGDCKALRGGVQELRIHFGPGYRLYLSRQRDVLVLMLSGSDKSDQDKEIDQAIKYLEDWKKRDKA